ncbi:MAG TPA: outer membrane lipoprotein-sorting protein [bacterium]|nr:outer membrane lipoprotein-sorting protein [bacterium]
MGGKRWEVEKLAAACLAAGLALSAPAFGQAPPAAPPASAPAPAPNGPAQQLTGDQVMQKVRDNQYSDTMDATIVMTLVDKNGISQTKRFRIQREKDKVLIRFLDPPDIKDTGYLIIQDENQKNLVYVYFPPPTDDYRQISVDDQSGNQAFLGSDFDVTDFQIQDPEQTENKYLRTEKLAGIECHVVESTPKDPNYKYGKVLSWVRTDYWLPIRVQFFDRQGKLVKDLKVKKFKSVGDRKVASSSEMNNLADDHKTLLDLDRIQFEVKFPDDNFTIRRLTKP